MLLAAIQGSDGRNASSWNGISPTWIFRPDNFGFEQTQVDIYCHTECAERADSVPDTVRRKAGGRGCDHLLRIPVQKNIQQNMDRRNPFLRGFAAMSTTAWLIVGGISRPRIESIQPEKYQSHSVKKH